MSVASFIRDWVVDPVGFLFLVSLLWLLLRLWKRFSFGRIVVLVCWVALFFLVSAPTVVNPWLLHYEDRYSENPACLASRPIVVLGGGADSRAPDSNAFEYLDHPTFVRVSKAIPLSEQFPNIPVIVVGGALKEISEAELMAAFLGQAGIDPLRIYQEADSSNTYENAKNVKALLFDKELDEDVNLVTSALHMRRAEAVFKKLGIQVCPVAVDQQGLRDVAKFAWWPQISAMNKFDLVLHESIAWIVYKLLGRL